MYHLVFLLKLNDAKNHISLLENQEVLNSTILLRSFSHLKTVHYNSSEYFTEDELHRGQKLSRGFHTKRGRS